MTAYRILYWKDFPAHIQAWDEKKRVKRALPDYFQMAIDGASMAEGSTDNDTYLAGWNWGTIQNRQGTATEVAAAVLAEVTAAYPKSRLSEMVRRQTADDSRR